MLGVYAIVGPAATDGWLDPATLWLGAASLVLLGLFVVREATAASPLVPLSIFRSRNVTGANLIQIASVAGMFGIFFMGSLYLKKVLGYGPMEIGFAFLPTTVLMGALSVRYTEPLASRFGPRPVMVTGLALIALGLVVFTQAPVHGNYAMHVLPVMVLLGVGAGLAFPSLMMLAMSGVSGDNAGLASGLINTTAQVGAALGLAVLATLSASRSSNLAATGSDVKAALTGGYHLAFWVAAGLVAVSIAVALSVLEPAPATGSASASEAEQRSPEFAADSI
jgi:predicted MFS family arabinose efflux permease